MDCCIHTDTHQPTNQPTCYRPTDCTSTLRRNACIYSLLPLSCSPRRLRSVFLPRLACTVPVNPCSILSFHAPQVEILLFSSAFRRRNYNAHGAPLPARRYGRADVDGRGKIGSVSLLCAADNGVLVLTPLGMPRIPFRHTL